MHRLAHLYGSLEEFLINVDPSICDELNSARKSVLLTNLYFKFNEVLKRLQWKNGTIIHIRSANYITTKACHGSFHVS